MQLPPNVEYWLRVLAIGVPAAFVIVGALVTYLFGRRMASLQKELNKELALYQSGLQQSLNKDLENHKKEISKELEIHKLQLQASFQTRFYEFQTRYSWLHQRKAEAIEKLYGMLARTENDLQYWVTSSYDLRNQTEDELYRTAEDHFQEMINFFDERRIYFDQETADAVFGIVETARVIYDQYPNIEGTKGRVPDLAIAIKQQAANLKAKNIGPLMARLETRFKKLLEAEMPSHLLDHTGSPDGSLDRKQ